MQSVIMRVRCIHAHTCLLWIMELPQALFQKLGAYQSRQLCGACSGRNTYCSTPRVCQHEHEGNNELMTIVVEDQSCQMLHDVANIVTLSTTHRVGDARADNKRCPRLQTTIPNSLVHYVRLRCPMMTKTFVYTESKSQAPGLHKDFKCSSECPTTPCISSALQQARNGGMDTQSAA